MRSVAKFVRDLVDVSDLQAIMVQVFRSPETTEADFLHRLQRSIQHYSSDTSDEGEFCFQRLVSHSLQKGLILDQIKINS